MALHAGGAEWRSFAALGRADCFEVERIYCAVRRSESSTDDRGANDVGSAGSFRLVELGARADQRRCFSCGFARQRAGKLNFAVALSAAAGSADFLLRGSGAGISKWRTRRTGPD